MRIIASIDIGSNTILLLVAQVSSSGKIIPLLEESRTPRLAFGLKQTGRIAEKNLKRALTDIKYFKKEAKRQGANEIYAVATQAVRSAKNRDKVIKSIKEKTGLGVEVISGKREAELTYLGAMTGLKDLGPRRIMFDIGGASSEFVIAEEKKIIRAISLPIGAVEITEKYRTNLKTSREAIENIDKDLAPFFKSRLSDFKADDCDLIGSGGTISTYKLLDSKPDNFDPALIHGKSLKLSRLEELIHELASLKLSERKRVITFEPSRAEVIVGGGLILRSLLRYFGKKTIRVSTRSLRWGFLLSKL